MEDNIVVENIEFDEKLYQRNIQESDFSGSEIDGIGGDDDANN